MRWNAACPAAELRKTGDYRLVEIAGDSLILVRDAGGGVRAHPNVCRDCGWRSSGRDPVPRPRWTQGLDGALGSAPYMDRVEGFSVSDDPLASAACAEWRGFPFVRIGPEGPELLEPLGSAASRLAPWELGRLRSAHAEFYDLNANWKLVVQNVSECLHCPVIHPQLQRLSHYLSGENYPVTPGAVGSAMDLAEGIETLSDDGRLVGAPLRRLGAAERRRIASDILMPNLMLCLHPDDVVAIRCALSRWTERRSAATGGSAKRRWRHRTLIPPARSRSATGRTARTGASRN